MNSHRELLEPVHAAMITHSADMTAIQLNDDEEFIIIASQAFFDRLQGQDLQNIIWQRALQQAVYQIENFATNIDQL